MRGSSPTKFMLRSDRRRPVLTVTRFLMTNFFLKLDAANFYQTPTRKGFQ